MVIPKINSAHGSDTRNIINRVIDLINAQGKSIQDLVAKGQLTPTQYAQLISIVNDSAKNDDLEVVKNRIEEILTETADGVSQQEIVDARVGSTGTSYDTLGEGVRTQIAHANDDLDYLGDELFLSSSNLYNPNASTQSYMYNSTGELLQNSSYILSDFIRVKENKHYYYHQFIRVSYFDRNKHWIGASELYENITLSPKTPPNTRYIRVQGLKVGVGSEARINEGSKLLPFEEYINEVVPNETLKRQVDIIEHRFNNGQINLYNESEHEDGKMYTDNGTLTSDSRYILTDYIEVESDVDYFYNDFIRVSYFDNSKNWIGQDSFDSTGTSKRTPVNAKYIRAQTLKNLLTTTTQINIGNELLNTLNIKSITLDWEPDGIQLHNGKIAPTHTENITNDWENVLNYYKTTRRTGKFLNIESNTELKLNFKNGIAYVFEYDDKSNFIKYEKIVSNQKYKVGKNTTLIKFMLEGLPEYAKPPTLSYIPVKDKKTWAFNTRDVSGYGNLLPPNKNINFVYEVFTDENRHILGVGSNEEQHSKERYFNAGNIHLPPNYEQEGNPVKLIIFCHGSNDYNFFYQKSFARDYEDYIQYLVDEGYAVMGNFDWTTKYYPEVNYGNTGSPIAYEAILGAYKWAIENYNIDQNGVFVSGKSSGGYHGFGLAYNKGIPVKAIGMHCPTISNMTTRLNSRAIERKAIAEDYGFVGNFSLLDDVSGHPAELKEFFMDNKEKMAGYNSYWNGIINRDLNTLMENAFSRMEMAMSEWEDAVRICNVPTKIWSAKDDAVTTLPQQHEIYIHTLKNGNSIGELRWMPEGTGGHNSTDSSPDALKVETITTKLGITHTNVPLAYVELVTWFRKFGG